MILKASKKLLDTVYRLTLGNTENVAMKVSEFSIEIKLIYFWWIFHWIVTNPNIRCKQLMGGYREIVYLNTYSIRTAEPKSFALEKCRCSEH